MPVASKELWKAIAPIFGLEDAKKVVRFELVIDANKAAEVTLTTMVDDAATEEAAKVTKRFSLTEIE